MQLLRILDSELSTVFLKEWGNFGSIKTLHSTILFLVPWDIQKISGKCSGLLGAFSTDGRALLKCWEARLCLQIQSAVLYLKHPVRFLPPLHLTESRICRTSSLDQPSVASSDQFDLSTPTDAKQADRSKIFWTVRDSARQTFPRFNYDCAFIIRKK